MAEKDVLLAFQHECDVCAGKLHVLYLGVPLVTKQLGINDCKNLIVTVKMRVLNWKNKMLTYAGRLQLIASVLSALHVYWASMFILPKTVIKDIDKIMKGFLWNQGEIKNGTSKVSWKVVCSPKSQGSLGLKNMSLWNETLMSKHLWNIACNKESWINEIRLKGKSKWSIDIDPNTSAGWKQILYLRDKIKHHIINKIGDGKTNFMCLNLNTLDSTLWITNKGIKGNFSTSKAWNDLKDENDVIGWWNVVWFNHCILRHAFILWLTIQGRLTTQDRLLKWYPGKEVEEITKLIPQNQNTSYDWEEIVAQASRWPKNKPVMSVIKRINLVASVYCIWNERNKRMFTNEVKDWKLCLKSAYWFMSQGIADYKMCEWGYILLDDACSNSWFAIVDVG
ncbi:RNA-directed DNA polymerase, eukaryota, reverse transcriptase zinc-binding domain protein [Tanacetum coccineum]